MSTSSGLYSAFVYSAILGSVSGLIMGILVWLVASSSHADG